MYIKFLSPVIPGCNALPSSGPWCVNKHEILDTKTQYLL